MNSTGFSARGVAESEGLAVGDTDGDTDGDGAELLGAGGSGSPPVHPASASAPSTTPVEASSLRRIPDNLSV